MPKIKYKDLPFGPIRQFVVDRARTIIDDYQAQGYTLTLRQLYYRFVALDLFPPDWKYVRIGDNKWKRSADGTNNAQPNYKALGDIIADARLAGLIDWNAMEDRTRAKQGNPHWESPADIIEAVAQQFRLDTWSDQKYRVEVWVEKEALEGIVERAARALDVDFFCCRGYTSLTSIWEAGQRLKGNAINGQTPVIIHLGDHDPSGVDMSRDIEERVTLFMDGYGDGSNGVELKFKRIALNMDQIKKYDPPPNPAKITDSRAAAYIEEFGEDSWELDALDPSVLDALIRAEVGKFRDNKKWNARAAKEKEHKHHLQTASDHWDGAVTNLLEDLK